MSKWDTVDANWKKFHTFWLKIRSKLVGLAFVLLVGLAVFVTTKFFTEDFSYPILPVVVPKSDTTLVTAFFTLNTLNDTQADEKLERFHSYLKLVLHLRMPLVIFTDEYSQEFVYNTRKSVQLENVTKIYNTSIETLPLFQKYDLFHDIILQEQQGHTWKPSWNQALKDLPETRSVEFMILENSKSYFLSNASKENVFNTANFAWIEANYGKGNSSLFPFNYEWSPVFPADKVSVLKMSPTNDSISLYNKEKLYRQNITLISGEFLAGDKKTIDQFHKLYEKNILDVSLNDRIIDDDETMLVLLINKFPSLFQVVQGEWFNAFHLFKKL